MQGYLKILLYIIQVLRSISRIVRPILLIATPISLSVFLTSFRGQTNRNPRNHTRNIVNMNSKNTVEYRNCVGNSKEKSILMQSFSFPTKFL